MSKVYLSIALYNGKLYLPDLFQSIKDQAFKDFTVIAIDNASSDGGADWIRRQYPETVILRNHKNLGFAKAHNQAIELALKFGGGLPSLGETGLCDHYMLVANQDLMFDAKFLEEIIDVADRYSEFGAFGGKVLKMFKTNNDAPLEKSTIIDTTGLGIKKSRRVYDRGIGEQDIGQYEKIKPVFGLSGACVLYRMSDLARASINGEYFDSAYFCYKEDVDLAWRMQNLGIKSLYVPKAIGYHYRGAYRAAKTKWQVVKSILTDKRSPLINQWSYRNQWLTILKNDRLINFLLHLPWILVEELQRFARYLVFLDIKTILAGASVWLSLPRIIKWRQEMKHRGLTPAKEIRKWFG